MARSISWTHGGGCNAKGNSERAGESAAVLRGGTRAAGSTAAERATQARRRSDGKTEVTVIDNLASTNSDVKVRAFRTIALPQGTGSYRQGSMDSDLNDMINVVDGGFSNALQRGSTRDLAISDYLHDLTKKPSFDLLCAIVIVLNAGYLSSGASHSEHTMLLLLAVIRSEHIYPFSPVHSVTQLRYVELPVAFTFTFSTAFRSSKLRHSSDAAVGCLGFPCLRVSRFCCCSARNENGQEALKR
eukprot:TRINITY_DN18481_c0_g1_i2.p1 TRINITY_DN18481_c0_g1~~TRINITY_DN18481_c0_g1_i2.p1  ORF type:complete len:244 (+),score=6.63 TRINITY_DN18481_c0_g1_i2:181-912(+)